jgi:signal peptidase II
VNIAKRLALILFVLVSCVGCDQTTKSFAQLYLAHAQVWSFLGDTVRLQIARNHGAFLGLGASLPEFWRLALFGVSVSALLLGLLIYALLAKHIPTAVLFAFALFFAGGFSNLTDRLLHGGYVVDFINIGVGPLRTGVFNVADLFISAGVLVLLWNGLRRTERDF